MFKRSDTDNWYKVIVGNFCGTAFIQSRLFLSSRPTKITFDTDYKAEKKSAKRPPWLVPPDTSSELNSKFESTKATGDNLTVILRGSEPIRLGIVYKLRSGIMDWTRGRLEIYFFLLQNCEWNVFGFWDWIIWTHGNSRIITICTATKIYWTGLNSSQKRR